MFKTHSFHIPVMGIGFTIDTPLKVSQFGIDSVISIVDDILLERIRKVYCEKFEIPYQEISKKTKDFRAKRITSYLNLINHLAEKKFDEFKNTIHEKGNELKEYFNMLPDSSSINQEFKSFSTKYFNVNDIKSWIKENLSMGSIDVNIMTKIDKDNYSKNEKLPIEYNDAHAALRGFANSDLHSSLVLSAGMNPRLYGYLEQFDDFFPNENGEIKKKIVLKVSDYRSALIQGKFLAKKGIWISEYRIESGLNCGGHAFATEGFLLGPILAEFRDHRKELVESVFEVLTKSLATKNRSIPKNELAVKITAQGGVGTAEEHQFLLDHYQVDSVGWGSPFLLVPEVSTVEEKTRNQLKEAKEEDLYLSNISPLGVPFNSLKGNTKDIEKLAWAEKGKPGSPCPKRYLISNTDYTEKAICTASHQYQKLKLEELKEEGLSQSAYLKKYAEIIDKSCICVGLGTSALVENNIDTKNEGVGVSVCPGPNIAYFSKIMSLKQITDHIYGRANMITRNDRPNMFIKELKIYIDFLTDKIEETKSSLTIQQEKYFLSFLKNLNEGINYYHGLFSDMKNIFEDSKSNILNCLETSKKTLQTLNSKIENGNILKFPQIKPKQKEKSLVW
ncbi:MAG: hypothetical protein HN704_12080 [Bacteroidetes bacterium]|nr:hypothetical protein [Bacteroidota bacterium]MBT6687458.1 hypothetical protein [Bacteroidota bacterium]MBT7142275.1 hypothetical protein [Bacteroidota bacterium]MBT7492330.1 hypothetical protein [Bacteroidota bacterium]